MNYFNYFTEIEETFIRRRGKHLLLSPLDWALIESWQEREIPLRIILRGIENVFDLVDKNPNPNRTIKSLTYCRDEIETQYSEWLATQVGKTSSKTEEVEKAENADKAETKNESTLFSGETIKTHLENVSSSIEIARATSNKALREVLDKIARKISEYRQSELDAESLETSLNDLETLIDKTLLESTDENSLLESTKQIEEELARHKTTMEKEVYQRTLELMLLKKLREDAEIPRLSLFYL